MEEVRAYKLDMDKIRKDFVFKDNGLTHSQCKEFKLLPYAANEKNLVSRFEGVIGAFSRIVSGKKLKKDFDHNEFIECMVDQIGEFEGGPSKDIFKDIVKTIFIDNESLVDFNVKTLNYVSSTSAEEKIAKFIFSIFFDDQLKQDVKGLYDKGVDNILYKLVLEALPELNDIDNEVENYKCYLPFIKELFSVDLRFLINNEELYKKSLKRFLEFYYMFYISQLTIKLSQFEKADLSKSDKIYYSLGFESISKNRTAYKFGWELLKGYVDDLFSHAITLEFLNHHNLNEQLGYKELFDIFNNTNDISNEIELNDLCEAYILRRQDGIVWNDFAVKREPSGNKTFDNVVILFEAVKYQFQGKASTRTRANDAYKKWYIKFVEDNFSKRRGSLGYTLNLTEEDIILLTKLCIKDNGKMKISVLFKEYEKRGVSFDRDSKIKVIQLFEKLNLLEKKSDSGDAQYVRSVL
jgi:DNA phosphorothioation-dependent restriction protein DptG